MALSVSHWDGALWQLHSGAVFVSPAPSTPSAPIITSLIAGDAQLTLNWQPPASNGGSAVTEYTVTVTPGSQVFTLTAAERTQLVTGLINNTIYTVELTATNLTGISEPATAQATPSAPEAEFDPRTYDWEANTGTNAALTQTLAATYVMSVYNGRSLLENATMSTADEVIIDNIAVTIRNCDLWSIRAYDKSSTRLTAEYCRIDKPAGGSAIGGGPLTLRYCRLTSNNDGCFPGDQGERAQSLLEYNWIDGPGVLMYGGISDRARTATMTRIARSTTYAVGDLVSSVAGNGSYAYECTVAGTTAATGPTFNNASGATTIDGTVTWIYRGTRNHMDGLQITQEGNCIIRRNKISGWPNACMIIKSDIRPNSDADVPITDVLLEENLFEKGSGNYAIYVRAGSLMSDGYSVYEGYKGRPRLVTIKNNWFVGDLPGSSCVNSGGSPSDVATFVQTEAERDAAVALEQSDPAVIDRRVSAGMNVSRAYAASWIVWDNNRATDTGNVIAPPRAYYTGE